MTEQNGQRKTFDCVEMKRRGAEHVRRLTQGMSREQVLEFWARRSRELQDDVRRAREQQQKKSA